MNPESKLRAVRAVHTFAWAVFAGWLAAIVIRSLAGAALALAQESR